MDVTDRSKAASPLQRFVAELRQRKVFRIAGVYIVSAWLIIQVAEATFEALRIPPWVYTGLILVLISGFPIAVVLAWIYEITPSGIVRDGNGGGPRPSRVFDLILISAVVGIFGFGSYQLLQYVRERGAGVDAPGDVAAEAQPEAPPNSIGVLPFENMSDERSNAYFGDGLAEEVLHLLAKLKELKVASRTSSFYFRDKDLDLPAIARQLGVRYVLEGSVRRQQNRVRVTAQLIDAGSGYHLWSDVYDRELADIFEIQTEISREVVDALEIVLSQESGQYLSRRGSDSVEAIDAYLQARESLRRPPTVSASTGAGDVYTRDLDLGAGAGEDETRPLREAEAEFLRALEFDADFAEAHAGLCETYLRLYELRRDTRYFDRAEHACRRSLALESSAGEVRVALGELYRYSGDYPKAETEFRAALERNPENVEAYVGLGAVYRAAGRAAEAERMYWRAIELQPGFWRNHQAMGNFLFESGRVQEAMPFYRRVTELTPDNARAWSNLGVGYIMGGDFTGAAEAWERSLELQPTSVAYSNTGSSYFYLGRFADAAEMYRRAVELTPDDHRLWGNLGDALEQLPDREEDSGSAYRRAIEAAGATLEINPADVDTLVALGRYHAKLGERERAEAYIARAMAEEPSDMYAFYDVAVARASLGDGDAALDAITRAVELGYPRVLVKSDAGLSILSGDERFRRLVESE